MQTTTSHITFRQGFRILKAVIQIDTRYRKLTSLQNRARHNKHSKRLRYHNLEEQKVGRIHAHLRTRFPKLTELGLFLVEAKEQIFAKGNAQYKRKRRYKQRR